MDPDTLVPDGGVDLDAGRPIPDVVFVDAGDDAGRPDAGRADAGRADAGDGGAPVDAGGFGVDGGGVVVDAGGQCADFAPLLADGDEEIDPSQGFNEPFTSVVDSPHSYALIAGPPPDFTGTWATLATTLGFTHDTFAVGDGWRLRVTGDDLVEGDIDVLSGETELVLDAGSAIAGGAEIAYPAGLTEVNLEVRQRGTVGGGTLTLFTDRTFSRILSIANIPDAGDNTGEEGTFTLNGGALDEVDFHGLLDDADLRPQGLLYAHDFVTELSRVPEALPDFTDAGIVLGRLRVTTADPGQLDAPLTGEVRRLRVGFTYLESADALSVYADGIGFETVEVPSGDGGTGSLALTFDRGATLVDLGGFGSFEVEVVYTPGAGVAAEVRCRPDNLAGCLAGLPIEVGCTPLEPPDEPGLTIKMTGPANDNLEVTEVFVHDQ